MVRRRIKTLKKYMELAGQVRWFRAFVALVMLMSTLIPAYIWMSDIKAYALTPETEKVIGPAKSNLSAKFSFDKASNTWQFNKNGVAALASNIAKQRGEKDVEGVAGALSQLAAKQIGGGGKNDTSLYSVDLPAKAEEGITYYDNVTRLSFKMVPNFSARDGKLSHGRIIYPFADGQVIYTAKSDGLKEDIVLSKKAGDSLSYGYKLELPETLEARIEKDGSIGVYSADPALFGDISFSNEEDKARVMEGRKNGHKEYRVFTIPAPFIKDQNGRDGRTHYSLKDNWLTVHASGLSKLKYPLSIDPSVTITSSADFEDGNNEGEGSIAFGNGEVRRGDVTGGTVGTWASADIGTAFTNARSGHSTVTYNGYIYVIGGHVTGGGATTDVRYAAICNGTNTNGGCTAGAGSAGKVGTWTSGGTLTEGRASNGVAVYNGFIYVVGGESGGANQSNNVQYSQIGANGAPGAWTNLGTFPTAIIYSDLIAYNGYLYVAGGCTNIASGNCSVFNGNVYSAAINGNGTLGSWTQLSGTPLTTARYGHTTFAYNGYLYVAGGCSVKDVLNNCTTTTTSTEYAKINSDGTLGTWSANTALSTARRDLKSTVANGYVYISGDVSISAYVSYAPIQANGVIGAWSSTNASATSKKDVALANYNGYLYITGGCTSNVIACNTGSNFINVSEYVKIDVAGSVNAVTATTSFDVEADGRTHHMSVAANGYIYVMGGQVEGASVANTVRYAPIAADGTVGAWSSGNSFSEQRMAAAVVVRGNYLYLIGGNNHVGTANCPDTGLGADYCNNIEWASINPSTGALTWQGSTFTYSSQGRSSLGAAVVNGYLYVLGGIYANNSTQSTEVNYAQFNADGSLGTFSTTTAAMNTGRANLGAFAHNGRIYAVGSRVGGAAEYATPGSGGDITSWTNTGNSPPGDADRYASFAYSKGYIYMTGGIDSLAGYGNDIQIAKVNADGTLSNWSVSPYSMSPNRAYHTSTIYNDYLYTLGGENSAINILPDVDYHRIRNGGSGTASSWTTSGSTFTTARQDHSSVAHNGYLYVIGGCSASTCTTPHNDVRYAVINADGTLGAWAAANTITARTQHTSVVYNGYLYVSGGNTGSFTNNTQYALICTGSNSGVAGCSSTPGSVGTWSNATNNFSNARGTHASVTYNGYLYIVGGNGAAEYNDVQYALLCTGTNTTGGCSGLQAGDIGTWTTDGGASFTNIRHQHAAIAYGGYLYVMGGQQTGTGELNDVQFAPINSDGSIGTWAYTNPLPSQVVRGKAVARNGYLYMAAGYASSAFVSSVYKVPIGSGGSLGAWEKTTSLNTARLQGALAEYNGTLYFSGGCTSGAFNLCTGFSNNVEHAGLQTIARIGHYSKLISVNPTTDIANVHYNGSLGEGSSVVYKVAPSSGIFGGTTAATFGTGSEPTPLCGQGTTYYVQLKVTLGDSTRAVFPDDNISTVTDVMTYYRLNATPPPSLRLTGGKWFNGEVQQPLDICKQ